jgi:hypothetical protein
MLAEWFSNQPKCCKWTWACHALLDPKHLNMRMLYNNGLTLGPILIYPKHLPMRMPYKDGLTLGPILVDSKHLNMRMPY